MEMNTEALPLVSVIMPCRNEARFIGPCLDSVLNNGYPVERLEILIVDGMSDDGTREVLRDYCARYGLIKVLDNRKRVTPYALNIGIRAAAGDIIMRLDVHTICERNYISRCVNALQKYQADDVGGVWRISPRDNTAMGRAIVKALTQKLGVGNLRHRFSKSEEPEIVDTVPFFCCPRDLFQRVGLFNEKLTRIQDMEFKRRLTRAGCKIMLVPGAVTSYQARSDLKSFVRHNWADGLWTVLAFAHSDVMPIRWRHLAPAALVAAILGSGFLALISPFFARTFLVIVGVYVLAAFAVGAKIAIEDRDFRYLFLVPLTISVLHIMRGLGSLWGTARLISGRRFIHAVRLAFQG